MDKSIETQIKINNLTDRLDTLKSHNETLNRKMTALDKLYLCLKEKTNSFEREMKKKIISINDCNIGVVKATSIDSKSYIEIDRSGYLETRASIDSAMDKVNEERDKAKRELNEVNQDIARLNKEISSLKLK